MHLHEMTSPQVAALDRRIPVVIPIAAVEQHGPHLPLMTDSMLVGEVARRAHVGLAGKILMAPLMWLGNSEHHLDFPGTMSAAPRTYLDLLKEMARNFLKHGFRRIVFLNGHGGNMIPAQQALFELRQETRDDQTPLLLHATYWALGDTGRPMTELVPDLVQGEMGHACEWETSMMLALYRKLVGEYQSLPAVPFGKPFSPAHRAWITRERTTPGYIGTPSVATALKGEQLFELFASQVVALLERVIAWDGVSWDG
jgi:creatinine amidohydrolase